MKKANFTSIPQEWLSRLGKAGALLLAMCLVSSLSFAQNGGIMVVGDGTYFDTDPTNVYTHTCGGTTVIADGGGASSQYEDAAASSSSVTICPDMPSMQTLKLTFQAFDLEDGDVLTVADENQNHVSVTGSSVADSPNGGWVIGDCNDYSGCLTIQFDTDGDLSKGAGFVAEVTCEARDVVFDDSADGTTEYQVATCELQAIDGDFGEYLYPFVSEVLFFLPQFDVCGQQGDLILSSDCPNGVIPAFDLLTGAGPFTDATVTDCGDGTYVLSGGTFIYVLVPVGQHDITFTGAPAGYACGDDNPFADKTSTTSVYIVQPPLVCNDDLNVSVDQSCSVIITPDLMLEDPCTPDELAGNFGTLTYTVELSEADVPNISALPTLIGTTDEGYPIYDFSSVECGTYFDVCITRTIVNINCVDGEPAELSDKCWGRILVEDKVPPVLVGEDQVVGYECYREDDLFVDGSGLPLEAVLNALVSNPNDIYSVVDNCSNSLSVGAWTEETVDCTDGGFDGLDPDGNGIADDVLWDIMAVEMGPAAVFKCYYRVIRAVDACGAVSSNFAIQSVCIYQPDIVFPEIEVEFACGTNIDPVALYELWASDPGWYPELATAIPNYDPTPLEVNTGQVDLGSLEDTYFTNASGDEVPADPRHAACGYAIDWVDSDPIEVCDGGGAYKLFRDWTVYNWCDGHLELIDVIPQVIKVGDNSAPIIDDFVVWYQGGSPYYDCAADLIMTPPDVFDECSGATQLFVSIQSAEVVNGELVFGEATEEIAVTPGVEVTIPNVPIGFFFLDFRAIDACGNEATYTDGNFFFDDISPVAICETSHTISLGSGESLYSIYQGYGLDSDCAVVVPAEVFDDGSYDNCGAIQFAVARMDSDSDGDGFPEDDDFGDFVVFTADDLSDGCTGETMVVFRVNDLSAYDFNGDGVIDGNDDIDLTIGGVGIDLPRTVDNDGENVNYCMVSVIVQDKLPPLAVGFEEVLKCNDPSVDDLVQASLSDDPIGAVLDFAVNEFGFISSFPTDNCEQYNGGQLLAADFSGFDATCRQGTVTYKVQWFDACDNPSNIVDIQYTVLPCSDWKMNFPMDAEVYCEDGVGLPAASSLGDILTNNGCDFWGLEVNEEQFEAQEGACYKVVREYHLINWCTWNPSNTEDAVVERPCDLILDPGLTVALRFRDAYRNDPTTGAAIYDADGDGIPDENDGNVNGVPGPTGPDGINDIDDGNEDFDYNFVDVPVYAFTGPNYIYRDGAPRGRNRGYAQVQAESAANCFPNFFDVDINDADEAADCDIYDVTALPFDGDFVKIDYADIANVPTYAAVSQFTGEVEHYVSAQAYGNIIYRQVLKVNDGTAPTLNITQNGPYCGGEETDADGNCVGNVDFKFTIADSCSPNLTVSSTLRPFGGGAIADPFGTVEATGDGEYRISGTYPVGTHAFTVEVIDGCGNVERQTVEFEVKDCKAPTAYCIFGLSADLMPTGMVELWASDFDAGSTDICSDVTLTFADPALFPDSINRVFRCADGEIGTVEVQLWATDAAGNSSFCTTFVNIQANQPNTNCPDGNGAAIAGNVETENGEMVENVEVSLSGNASAEVMTSNDGSFMFAGLETGYDYSVTPERDDNPLNGVSTFDLVLISKHILGVESLDSPYKLIAADINNSGSITTFDMVTLRKVILNIESDFPNNTSWRFVSSDYNFADPANPFGEAFPEVMNFNNLDASYLDAKFVAIKVGDVNDSAAANSLIGSTEGRSASTFNLNVDNRVLKAGETTTVNFTADLAEVAGYQFTLDFAGLELVEVVEGAATAANFGIFANQLTASWNDVATSNEAFGLTFVATEDVVLSEALNLNSSRTAAEAYTTAGELQNVALNFNAAGFELYQNTPNPFNETTVISFSLPTTQNATLTVSDAAGKVLKVIDATYAEGYNQVELSAKSLAPGVLSYTLATKEFTATKKMVILE